MMEGEAPITPGFRPVLPGDRVETLLGICGNA